MEDVYYVPDLKSNILSMGQLLEKGCSVFMKDRMLHLKDKNGRVLAHIEMAKKSDVLTQLEEYTREVFASQHGGQRIVMAFTVWTPTFRRAKRVSKEGHGPRATEHGLHQEIL